MLAMQRWDVDAVESSQSYASDVRGRFSFMDVWSRLFGLGCRYVGLWAMLLTSVASRGCRLEENIML